MAPSVATPKPAIMARKGSYLEGSKSTSREVTPTPPRLVRAKTAKGDAELATVFKSDLTSIRNLVTCSICDQLLYEPWTLGCGHTYCYSCLCNWFVPNKRKKTCPECRSKVKQMPAPSFMVKQMVEIFTKRTELMPPDESVEQHAKKRAEEIADVDRDRNSSEGLFKGTFPERRAELWLDEADGVLRCPSCGHEHEGGPSCENCGAEFDEDGYGFSDVDDEDLDDLENLELDLDAEVDAEFADLHAHHHFMDMHGMPHVHFAPGHFHHRHVHGHHLDDHTSPSITSNSDDDPSEERSESDSEDDSSLREFVVPDDESPVSRPRRRPNNGVNQRQTITISDDESDEGGPITNSRVRRGGWTAGMSTPPPASVLTVTDDSTNGSEAGDITSEAEMLRHAGWSPLDQGDDSEAEDHVPYPYRRGYTVTDDDRDSDDESDTGTMVGNEATDDEQERRPREQFSRTPTYERTYDRSGYPSFNPYGDIPHRYPGDDADDDDSDAGQSSIMDRDGDTEMSVSPRTGRGVSLSTNDYGEYPESRSSRGPSLGTDYDYDGEEDLGNGGRGVSVSTEDYEHATGENLGMGHELHQVEDDSSDGAIQETPRRQPRRHPEQRRGRNYDPRISLIFAEHQDSLRGGTRRNPIGLDDLGPDARNASELDALESDLRVADRNYEPSVVRQTANSSRARRSTSYRLPPPRQLDPLRSTRSPSVTRIISSSNRATRLPRQYVNTYHL